MSPNPAPVLDRDAIQRLIPHRPPFLWLDEVLEISPTSVRAVKYLDPQLDVFAGHYPHHPVLPGVLLCEALFQAGAVLMAHQFPPSGDEDRVPVVTRVNDVRFRRPVRPGETLVLKVQFREQLATAFFFAGKAEVGGEVAARLEFACTLAPLS